MPTFPQHRNIKGTKNSASADTTNTGVGDQTNNLPAISDLVKSVNEYFEFSNFYVLVGLTCQKEANRMIFL